MAVYSWPWARVTDVLGVALTKAHNWTMYLKIESHYFLPDKVQLTTAKMLNNILR